MKSRTLFVAAALATISLPVHAQDYPARLITAFVAALGEISLLNA